MIKSILAASILAAIPIGAHAEPESYCSGPSCADATATSGPAQTTVIPPIPPHILYGFWFIFMMDDYTQSYPNQIVQDGTFASGAVTQLELHDVANLLLFLDPHTRNFGLVPSDFAANGATPSGDPELPVHSDDPGQEPFDFRFMTTGDYVGELEWVLDELIVRYPDQTVSANALVSSSGLSLSMTDVANLLIFLDPYVDNLGWSPSVFEPDA